MLLSFNARFNALFANLLAELGNYRSKKAGQKPDKLLTCSNSMVVATGFEPVTPAV